MKDQDKGDNLEINLVDDLGGRLVIMNKICSQVQVSAGTLYFCFVKIYDFLDNSKQIEIHFIDHNVNFWYFLFLALLKSILTGHVRFSFFIYGMCWSQGINTFCLGTLVTFGSFDHETEGVVNISVSVSDNDGLQTTAVWTMEILNVNDAPSVSG